MAYYDYQCPVHGIIEIEHSVTVKMTECPECAKDNIKTDITRLISKGTKFVLLGGNWSDNGYGK